MDGDITYYTTGAPGSQVFVLSYTDVPHYPGPEGTFPITVQVQLYEGTQEVRIVTTNYNGDGGLSTMGLNKMLWKQTLCREEIAKIGQLLTNVSHFT